MKLCRDCENFRPEFGDKGWDSRRAYCAVPHSVDPSTAEAKFTYCSIRRSYHNYCGENAKDFVPRQRGDSGVVVIRRMWFGRLVTLNSPSEYQAVVKPYNARVE